MGRHARGASLVAALALMACDPDASAQRAPASRPAATAAEAVSDDVFVSREACEAWLRGRAPRTRGPRVGSWNVRWFPDGSSGGPSDQATDQRHLACVIAALDVDAIALQELVLHERGLRALAELTDALDRHTGGRWTAHLDECRRDGRQHVGWLINERVVRADPAVQLDALNPTGDGCAHHLRPGLAVYLRFASGPDLHAITVHLDSGVEERDQRHRRQSLEALGPAIASLRPRDDDVLVIGDLNTMGTRRPQLRPAEELAQLDATIAGLPRALRRLESSVACTEFYRGRGSLLDHALVTTATTELGPDARLEVAGPCARYECRLPRSARPASLARLSDHCPIVVELGPRD